MTLTQDLFVKLSFHAKMHKLLDYSDMNITEKELATRIENQIDTTIEKIEKKELDHHTQALDNLKHLATDLRQEFDSMKREKKLDL